MLTHTCFPGLQIFGPLAFSFGQDSGGERAGTLGADEEIMVQKRVALWAPANMEISSRTSRSR